MRCRPPHLFRRRSIARPTRLAMPVKRNFPFILPINIRCNSCSKYILQGTHLVVVKEQVLDEMYPDFECCKIGLKCTNCSADIWIWSDPENRDYAVRSGATKKRKAAVFKKPNYQVAVSKKRKRKAEEGGDALKSLENTTLGSKREIAALDKMKSMESQHATVSADAMLEDLPAKAAKKILALWGAAKYVENRTLDSKREIAVLDKMKSMESQHATVSADAMLENWPAKVAKRILALWDGLNITLDSTTDGLKSVENTTLDSEREIAALDEMESMESQHATVSADATLEDWPAKVAKRILALWDASNITLDSTTDGLKYVENTTLDSKREIAVLDEMKSMEILRMRSDQPKLPRRDTLRSIGRHCKTDKPISKSLCTDLLKNADLCSGIIGIEQVRLGILDLQLHSEYIPDGTKTALDYIESVYKSTSLYPMLQEDRSFCTSSHIFTDEYAAGYYGYKWSEMMAVDVFSAFEAAGLNDKQDEIVKEAMKKMGCKFRDTIFALGCGNTAKELFKQFMEKEHSSKELLKQIRKSLPKEPQQKQRKKSSRERKRRKKS